MFRTSPGKTFPWLSVFISVLALLAAGCSSGADQSGVPAPQRETLELAKVACYEAEFRRLPFGLTWECPQGEVKLPIGTGVLSNVQQILRDEEKDVKRGGVLTYASVASTSTSTEDLWRNTCCSLPWTSVGEPLIRRTAAPEAKLVPNLAESWEVSKDGLTYTFKLRQGVKFHDKPPANGRELEARDVVDSYTYMMGWKHPGTPPVNFPRQNAVANLTKIEALDKYTVKLTLGNPNAEFLIGVADGRIVIFPEGLVEWNGGTDLNRFPEVAIGTGPFVLTEYSLKSRSVWVKHPNYWEKAPDGKPYPYLDGFRLERVGDRGTMRAALIAGQVDLLQGLGDEEVDELLAARPNLRTVTAPGRLRNYTLLNYKNPQYSEVPGVWTHLETRWAFMLWKDWCKYGQIVKPKSWRYQLFWGAHWPEHRSQEELSTMPGLRCQTPEVKHQDRLKAVELLNAAGYPKGFFAINYEVQSTSTAGSASSVYAAVSMADLNKVMPEKYGLTEWRMEFKKGITGPETARVETQQLYDHRTNNSNLEPTTGITIYADWHCDGGRNYQGHCNNWNGWWKDMYGLENMTMNRMWELQQAELDPAKRLRMIKQIEHYLIWNMAWVPELGQLEVGITQPYVKAFAPNLETETPINTKHFKWTWLDK